jgi:hypothetical protein
MTETLPPVVESAPIKDKSGLAIGSFVLGILSLCSWLIPFCGGPIAIAGVVLGVLGMKSSKKGMAIAGIVMSAIGIGLTLINAVAGALLAPYLGNFDMNSILNNYLPQ